MDAKKLIQDIEYITPRGALSKYRHGVRMENNGDWREYRLDHSYRDYLVERFGEPEAVTDSDLEKLKKELGKPNKPFESQIELIDGKS